MCAKTGAPRIPNERMVRRMSVARSSPAMLLLLATTASLGGAQETERALAVEREVRRIAAERALWPGFEPLEVPLAVFTGDATYLFRHPAPPDRFEALAGRDLPTFVFVGRQSAVVANSVADFGGALTPTVLATESFRGEVPTELASVALHEAFHVFQRQRYATWSANEGDLFLYPNVRADDRAARRSRDLHPAQAAGVSRGFRT